MKYLLDTDHLSILERGTKGAYENLVQRMAQCSPSDFVISIITVQEQILGCHNRINKARKITDLVKGYALMEQILKTIRVLPLISFDSDTALIYQNLQSQRLQLARMDALIAATALRYNLILLTRNFKDFKKVTELVIEDWTINENEITEDSPTR